MGTHPKRTWVEQRPPESRWAESKEAPSELLKLEEKLPVVSSGLGSTPASKEQQLGFKEPGKFPMPHARKSHARKFTHKFEHQKVQ